LGNKSHSMISTNRRFDCIHPGYIRHHSLLAVHRIEGTLLAVHRIEDIHSPGPVVGHNTAGIVGSGHNHHIVGTAVLVEMTERLVERSWLLVERTWLAVVLAVELVRCSGLAAGFDAIDCHLEPLGRLPMS
jgi:hypothetical protein